MKKVKIITPIPKSKSYPKDAFEIIQKAESHFWFAGRNEVIKIILNRFLKPTKGKTFIEIGCGNGIVLTMLEKLSIPLTGLDINMAGLKIAQQRTKSDLICADIYRLTAVKKYDMIGMFDVVEHIKEDNQFLIESGKLLKKNGKIILTVPADKKLWSQLDVVSGHKRRYTKQSLINLLIKSGYTIEFISYFNCLFYLPQLLFRKLSENNMKKSTNIEVLANQLTPPFVVINLIMKWFFILEAQLLKAFAIPFGASLVVVASKKRAR